MEEKALKLKEKIDKTTIRLNKMKEDFKKICPHENIQYDPPSIDWDSYYRDAYPGWIQCKDCGVYGSEGSEIYKYLLTIYKKK